MEFRSKKYNYMISYNTRASCSNCAHNVKWSLAKDEEECMVCVFQKGFNSKFCVCKKFEKK